MNMNYHPVLWGLYVLYFFAINRLSNEDVSLWTTLGAVAYFAAVFYGVSYLLKRYARPRKYFFLAGSLLLGFGLSCCLIYYLTYGNGASSLLYGRYVIEDRVFSWSEFFQTCLVIHGHCTLLALLGYFYASRLDAMQQQLLEMQGRWTAEQRSLEYEYVALAGQVSPHTLLNVFQHWGQQLQGDQPPLAKQIMQMYTLMQFYMRAHEYEGAKLILLHDEVEATKRYLQVQREVANAPIYWKWEVYGNLYATAVPATSLLVLVENALKHGDCTDASQPVQIRIDVRPGELRIQVCNRRKKVVNNGSSGTGIKNLKRRWQIAYGDDGSFDVWEDEDGQRYHVQLLLREQEMIEN